MNTDANTEPLPSTPPSPALQVLERVDPQLIDASPYQSRKHFEEQPLAELTASVREHGIIQPLVGRRSPTAPGRIELVAGERRLRAGLAAGLALVPVLISQITDAAAEAMVLTENLQREGLTPTEEAHAFQRLMALRDGEGKALYTQAMLSKMISKDEQYITARLKLLVCPPELVKAVDQGLVSVSTAMLIGRIPDEKARGEAAKALLAPEHQQVPLNFLQTREMVRERFMVKIEPRSFDPKDTLLVPVKLDDDGQRCQGGDCLSCPFRSGNLEGVDAKGKAETMLCTLPRCHALKLDARWRELKADAEKAGKKTLDGAAAKKVFSGYEGRLAYDCGLVDISEKIGYLKGAHVEQSWKTKLKDSGLTLVTARNPVTNKVVELVDKKEAEAFVVKSRGGSAEKGAEAQRDEELLRKQRKAEIKQQRIDGIALTEGLNDIMQEIERKGAGCDVLRRICEMALGRAGADGLKFLAKYLGVEIPKNQSSWGLEDPVMKVIRKRCEDRAVAWHGMTTLVLLSWAVAHSGIRSEDFKEACQVLGLKIPDLQRRAKALVDTADKGKVGKAKDAKKTTKGTAVDPVDVDAEKEAGKTKAADAAGRHRTVSEYKCDECGIEIYTPFGVGTLASQTPKGQMHCGACGGTWKNEYQGLRDAGFRFDTMHIDRQAMGVAREALTYEECLGHEPKDGTPAHKIWSKAKVELERVVKKVKRKLTDTKVKANRPAKTVGTVGEIVEEMGGKDLFGLGEADDRDGPLMAAARRAVVEVPAEWHEVFKADADGAAADVKGEDAAGLVSSVGVPLTEAGELDVPAAAELLKTEQITITELIGPKPHRQKEPVKYKLWNSTRMQLLRKAGKAA